MENISKEFPPVWTLLLKQQQQPKQTDALNFTLRSSDHNKLLTDCNNKVIYNLLVGRIIKPPTANTTWTIRFPEYNTAAIWTNIDTNFLPQAVYNTEFKIRHRKIVTCTMLYQINKEKYSKNSASCKLSTENLEHIFLECTSSHPFKNLIWDLLRRRCNFFPQNQTLQDFHFLFGIFKKEKSQNKKLINMILAFAKHTIYYARNVTLHENTNKPLELLQKPFQETLSTVVLRYEGQIYSKLYGQQHRPLHPGQRLLADQLLNCTLDFGKEKLLYGGSEWYGLRHKSKNS